MAEGQRIGTPHWRERWPGEKQNFLGVGFGAWGRTSVGVWIPRWMELFSASSLPAEAERKAHKSREPIDVEKNTPTALKRRRSCGSRGN